MSAEPLAPPPRYLQATLDDLGTPLSRVTFVVVDLETTGGDAATSTITEIGAVKVRGGQELGEFHTLVNPCAPIPPFISVLTGITDGMVAGAPTLRGVLPAFLEFAAGAVLVAHNAPFDTGFLRAACAEHGLEWPGFAVIDTVHLARALVSRDEAPNHRLGTLAALFGSPTTPDHRALHDARATVHVLHAMLERLGNIGVQSLEELRAYTPRVRTQTRRKRHLADSLPHAPGVYVFRDELDRVLYVGTSVDLRTRVRSYFTASEQRSRMAHMVARAVRVVPIVCESRLEANVRELRLIAEHDPPYNRRSRRPERAPWVKLTVEPFPRLSVVREVREDGAEYLGPFGSADQARAAITAVQEAFALRQCTQRLPAGPRPGARSCLLADLGRCGAPCTGGQTIEEYARIVSRARTAMAGDATPIVTAALERAENLARQERYEEAAEQRDRLVAFLRGATRCQRVTPIAAMPEIVAALARRGVGGRAWEVVLVRYGRLAGTTVTPAGADPRPAIDALRLGGEVVLPATPPLPAAHPEETETIARWLEQPGVRLVDTQGDWTCPVGGAAGALARINPDGSTHWTR